MTREELIARVRKAPGADIYVKINAVVDEIGKRPKDLKHAWEVLAPWALHELERRTRKQSATPLPVPIGNSGVRKPALEWRRPDVIKARIFLGNLSKTTGQGARLLAKIEQAYQNDNETLGDIRDRLAPGTWKAFCKWAGIRRLGDANAA